MRPRGRSLGLRSLLLVALASGPARFAAAAPHPVPVPVPLPLPAPAAPAALAAPVPRQYPNGTQYPGVPVNITEKQPFMVPSWTQFLSAAHAGSASAVASGSAPDPTPPLASSGTLAAATAAPSAAASASPSAAGGRATFDEQVAAGGGTFLAPAAGSLWTITLNNVAKWVPLNATLEVWMTNDDRGRMRDDVLLATETSVLVTSIPDKTIPGTGYYLYLSPAGNSSHVLSQSETFAVRTLVTSLFNSASPAVAPPLLDAATLALGGAAAGLWAWAASAAL